MTPEQPRLTFVSGASDNSPMTAHVPRLPSLDPLMAEARRRMRQRRLLSAAVVVALAMGVAGATLALRGSDGPSGPPTAAGRGGSHHATAADLRAIQQARVQLAYLRGFPRVPGTAQCAIHAGGFHLPGTPSPVLHGFCSTSLVGSGQTGIRVRFSERWRPWNDSHHGSFLVTLDHSGRVLSVGAAGQTPQTWR